MYVNILTISHHYFNITLGPCWAVLLSLLRSCYMVANAPLCAIRLLIKKEC